MFTKEHLLRVLAEVPSEFSLDELAAILGQPGPAVITESISPTSLILAQANEWAYYMSPEAKALYASFSSSPSLVALRGIASQLPANDLRKTAQEWEAERIQAKYGL